MKTLFLFIACITNNIAFAIHIVPPKSKSIICTNINNTNKGKVIAANEKVTMWYTKQQNELKKITGKISFIDDSVVHLTKKGTTEVEKISIQKITAITKRNAFKFVASSVLFVQSTVGAVGVIQLLSRVTHNNNNPNNTPTESNALAGVVGIVFGVIVFPIFIVSSITVLKQLLHKKLQTKNGWQFKVG